MGYTVLDKIRVGMLSGFSIFLSKMPQVILNIFSWFVFIVIYRIARYRTRVVGENLCNSFPDKSKEELKRIEVDFYKFLGDVFIETLIIKGFSREDMQKRMVYKDNQRFESEVKGKSALVTMAHYGMWEYTIGYSMQTSHSVYAVYHKLTDSVMDDYFKVLRSKFGSHPLEMKDVARKIYQNQQDGNESLYALIADQTPPRGSIKHRIMFLNQATPFFNGMEKLALKYKLPVYFLDIKKVKRGYYESRFIQIYDGVSPVKEDEITKRYASQLEKAIVASPHYWMWSHRRWKHIPLSHETVV